MIGYIVAFGGFVVGFFLASALAVAGRAEEKSNIIKARTYLRTALVANEPDIKATCVRNALKLLKEVQPPEDSYKLHETESAG